MTIREFDFEKEPIVSIVKKILTDSIKMKATDIHLDPLPNELVIKFRINGNLTEYTIVPESAKINILTRIKILANMNITESLLPQIGAINFDNDGESTNMRVSSLPVADGEKIVVHISNYAKNLKNISKIGIRPDDVAEIKSLLKEQQGIILITGSTASGKTTTMYSILKEINNKSINIISIEDPIKMKIEGVNQVQIAPEKGLTYRNILRNVLLQDPNVICINELVDDETTRGALRAAITGRLVISTMHTKSAYTTIDTLLNMDVENYLLGANLLGIISQRLVKKLCPVCREKKKATDYEKTIIKRILGKKVDELYHPKGCSECQGGYNDQLPVIEVVTIDDELRSAISNNKSRDLIRSIITENNNTILKDGFQKVIDGDTSFDEMIRITDIRIDFTKEEQDIKEFILGNIKQEEPDIEDDDDDETTINSKEIPKDESEEQKEKETKKQKNLKDSIEITKLLANLEKENQDLFEGKNKKQEETKSKFNDDDDDDDEDDFNYGDAYSIF